MAYPTVDAPYGLRPVNLIGGRVYSGSTRQMAIASGEGTSIFYGDIVVMTSAGTVSRVNTSTDTTGVTKVAGVFMGCSYINSQGQRVFSQYFPSGTTGTLDTDNMIVAFVADDPQLVMKVAVVTTAGAVSGRTRDAVGENAAWINGTGGTDTGSTVTGDSKIGMNSVTATTTTLPLRVVDVVQETRNASGSFTELLVTWNTGVHLYTGAAGV